MPRAPLPALLPPMKLIRFLAATAAVAFLTTLSAFAAANAEGTWTWVQPGRDADITVSATFVAKAGQLTGTFTNVMGTVPVTELVVKDDTISFEIASRRAATKYTGKISGDTITGSIEIPARGGVGDPRKVEWKAKRGPAPAK